LNKFIRKRNDLAEFKESVQNGIVGLELMEKHSEIYAKYPRFVHDYVRAIKESKVDVGELNPRVGWQTRLKEELTNEPDQRKVIWYYDVSGNNGKSYFATRYKEKSTYLVTGGRNSDIYYAYGYEEVVFFDLPRCKQEYVPYDVMESFKNGYYLSTKYEVKCCKFKPPHVVVFANFYPDTTKLSLDRWDIREI
jgi:hypothetical protein